MIILVSASQAGVCEREERWRACLTTRRAMVNEDETNESGMEAFPSEGGDQAPSRLNIPRNPAVTAPENRMRNPNKFGLMRKESFGVPRIKNHTELLKGMFEKKQLPPGMTSLK